MAAPAEAIVVDASVAAKWHLEDEEYVEPALLLLQRFARGEVELLAPEQIRYEVPSAITVATLGQQPRLTQQQGEDAIAEFLALDVHTTRDPQLILAAYRLVHRHGCGFYDALYVALAEQVGCSLVTADERLYRRIRHLPYAVWIANYT